MYFDDLLAMEAYDLAEENSRIINNMQKQQSTQANYQNWVFNARQILYEINTRLEKLENSPNLSAIGRYRNAQNLLSFMNQNRLVDRNFPTIDDKDYCNNIRKRLYFFKDKCWYEIPEIIRHKILDVSDLEWDIDILSKARKAVISKQKLEEMNIDNLRILRKKINWLYAILWTSIIIIGFLIWAGIGTSNIIFIISIIITSWIPFYLISKINKINKELNPLAEKFHELTFDFISNKKHLETVMKTFYGIEENEVITIVYSINGFSKGYNADDYSEMIYHYNNLEKYLNLIYVDQENY